jgi:hypothetical protein
MKMNTLQKLRDCLANLAPRVEMEESLRQRAEAPLLRMLEQSNQISISPSKTKSAGPVRVTLVKEPSPDFSKPISRVSPPSTSTGWGRGHR